MTVSLKTRKSYNFLDRIKQKTKIHRENPNKSQGETKEAPTKHPVGSSCVKAVTNDFAHHFQRQLSLQLLNGSSEQEVKIKEEILASAFVILQSIKKLILKSLQILQEKYHCNPTS